MSKAIIKKEALPDIGVEEIEIFPHGDATMSRIGVMKFSKGTSKLILDPGQPEYRSMNEDKKKK